MLARSHHSAASPGQTRAAHTLHFVPCPPSGFGTTQSKFSV